jgi:carbon storage regulator CsrA
LERDGQYFLTLLIAKTGPTAVLYLTRKTGEAIVINETVEITVVSVQGRTVKLGFNLPPGDSVLRKEVYERIQAENRAAAENARLPGGFTIPKEPEK